MPANVIALNSTLSTPHFVVIQQQEDGSRKLFRIGVDRQAVCNIRHTLHAKWRRDNRNAESHCFDHLAFNSGAESHRRDRNTSIPVMRGKLAFSHVAGHGDSGVYCQIADFRRWIRTNQPQTYVWLITPNDGKDFIHKP